MDAIRGISAAADHRPNAAAPIEGSEEAPIDLDSPGSDHDSDAAGDDVDSSDGGVTGDSDSDATSSVVSDLSTRKPRKGTRADINQAMAGIKAVGDFAAFAPIQGEFEPVIQVNGVGNIKLPLGEAQARQIIGKAHQAPYGKGSETLVDVSVRRTFELDPDQFEMANPVHWSKIVNKQLGVVLQKLGVDSKGVLVHAELYKMLIYEEGAMFKAHTDTEKIPGMFATMVISLPSRHQGGDVVVKHGGKIMKLQSSSPTCRPSVLAWYSDVSHEVLPVTSGYRWVLTYNLALSTKVARPTAAMLRSELQPLRHSLRRWIMRLQDRNCKELEYLYYCLDHEYTEAQCSLRNLKHSDYHRISALKQMAAELRINIFLAVLEKEERGDVEVYHDPYGYDDEESEDEELTHTLADVIESSLKIKQLVDLDGNVLLSEVEADEDFEGNLIQEDMWDLFEGVTPEEEYEGFMGNWGPQATHWYRTAVAVIVPYEHTAEYLDSREEMTSGLLPDEFLEPRPPTRPEAPPQPRYQTSQVVGVKRRAPA